MTPEDSSQALTPTGTDVQAAEASEAWDPEQLSYSSRQKMRFLAEFSRTGNVSWASELAGCSSRSIYNWLKADEAFAAAFREAEKAAVDVLEKAAWGRAVHGVPNRFGEQQFSDVLLMFLLKSRDPKKYAQRTDLVLQNGEDGPFQIVVSAAVKDAI